MQCICCEQTKQLCVHHIIERKLFKDGGYYQDNGVTLCEKCHLEAERAINRFLPKELRIIAKIENVILPDKWDNKYEYDKWGNIIIKVGGIYSANNTLKNKWEKIFNKSGYVIRFVSKEYLKEYHNIKTDLNNLFIINNKLWGIQL